MSRAIALLVALVFTLPAAVEKRMLRPHTREHSVREKELVPRLFRQSRRPG